MLAVVIALLPFLFVLASVFLRELFETEGIPFLKNVLLLIGGLAVVIGALFYTIYTKKQNAPKARVDYQTVTGCVIIREFDSSKKRRYVYYVNSDQEVWKIDNPQLFAKVRVGDSVVVKYRYKYDNRQLERKVGVHFIDLIPIGKCGGSNSDISVSEVDGTKPPDNKLN
ncbi:MAG: hypothetical protein M5Z89_14115 [Olivibacter sp.]|nr:hypothetical protein [Olivibacter sp. UJ_SKK_5.1]